MTSLMNKIFGKDEDSRSNGDKHSNGTQGTDGRTVQYGDVIVKSTITSDNTSSVTLANQQRVADLVTQLGSTHSQIEDYAKKEMAQINAEIQREVDQVVMRTHQRQDELLQKVTEHMRHIDADYRAQLQKVVEEADAVKAKSIASVEHKVNKEQAQILEDARAEIDRLNKKAANMKIGVLKDAEAKVAADSSAISAQAASKSAASTVQSTTGTTMIKTETSSAPKPKTVGETATTETHVASTPVVVNKVQTTTYEPQKKK